MAFKGSKNFESYCVCCRMSLMVCFDSAKFLKIFLKVLSCCLACVLQRPSKFLFCLSLARTGVIFPGGTITTLGSSTLCTRGCCHPLTCLMPVAEVPFIFRHGALKECHLWAGWCMLPSEVTCPQQRGNRLRAVGNARIKNCSCLSVWAADLTARTPAAV